MAVSLHKKSSFLFVLSTLSLLAMQCTDFGEFKHYGEHYYAITGAKFSFAHAKQIAENNGGYLAIPNTAAENTFLSSSFGTAWIGIYDPSLSQSGLCYWGQTYPHNTARFKTVKNEPLSYTNWISGEPNNALYEYDIVGGKQMVSPLGEHWIVLGENGQWGSFGNHAQENNNPVQFKAIFEFDSKPECVVGGPTSEPLLERKCTETIYNTGTSTSGNVINDGNGDVAMSTSNTFTCQKDTYGNEFCPAQMAKCDSVWGYDQGYSLSHALCPDGSAPLNGICKTATPACPAGNYFNGTNCTALNYAEPLSNPTVYNISWWNCNSGCSGQFPQTLTASTDAIWSNATTTSGFYAALIMVARAAGATWWNFRTLPCLQDDGEGSCLKYTACGQSFTPSYGANHKNFSQTCLFVTDKYGSYPTEFTHNAFAQVTTYDTGGGKPMYYASSTINKCQNLVYVQGGKDFPSHYKCMDPGALSCPTGYSLTAESGGGYSCIITSLFATQCPSSYPNVTSDGYCYANPNTYYTYHCQTTVNQYNQSYTLINPGGTGTTSPTPPINNCKIESFSCVPATDRKCSFVSNQWQCSPFPCFGESNLESADTTLGATDSANKGFNTDGSCSGQIRLFNGKDMRCRSWDILFGLLGGGCCQRDNGTGLGALFGGQCKEDERLLAKYRKETLDKSHYVGEYCSKYLKLGFTKICVQKKKTYCVFNSKLARILHEQGRPQINIAWDGAKAPNCKGFTPEEFQKIDFSKLDLFEFYGDLESKIKTTFDTKVGATISQKVSSFGVNINGN